MTTAHDFSFAKLDQPGEIKLADYAGQVVLLVNVASACGFTSQYRDLEALYEAKVGKGFVIIGIPCNDFGHQEPGDAREIREFCDTSYHVTFPMTAKVEIVPAGDSLRTRWLPASTMSTEPSAVTVAAIGLSSCARTPDPPSPEKPGMPVPAIVVIRPSGRTRRTR